MSYPEGLGEKQARLFKLFVQKRKIMIVDVDAFSRAALAQVLVDLGASPHQISLISTFAEAQVAVMAEKPDILLADFDLDGGNCGLDLLSQIRKRKLDTSKSLFILVTGNTSQAAVARAAEEDVDGYLLKPYTSDGIRLAIMKYATEKIYPSEYQLKIQEGKRKLEEKSFDEAMSLFEEAAQLDQKPSLACFYQGITEEMRKTLDAAEKDYGKGLSFNHIHYKCLVGLFELHSRAGHNKEAYDVAQRLARYFPASPERLATVLKLAVVNEAFEDIERYYRLFCKLDQRNELLVRYVCAALIVCGKYFLQQQKTQRAIELFERAKATGACNPKYLREAALALLGVGHAELAWNFVEAYPTTHQSTPEYRALRYAATEGRSPIGASIAEGRKLLAEGVQEYILYFTLLKRSLEAELADQADQLAAEAIRLWPDKELDIRRIQKESRRPAA